MENQTKNIQTVKFTFKDQVRRFRFSDEFKSLSSLIGMVKLLCKIAEEEKIVVKYLDDEGEWIVVEHDVELECAVFVSGEMLRLSVSVAGDVQEDQWVPKWKRNGGRQCRGKGKRGGWKWRNKQRNQDEEVASESNGSGGNDEQAEDEPKWMKYRRQGRGRRGGKWRNVDDVEDTESDLDSETQTEPPRFARRGRNGRGRRGGRRWRNRQNEDEEIASDESVSDVDTTLSLEEIKAQIEVLIESKSILQNKLKGAREAIKAKREEIKACKNSQETKDADHLASLRSEIVDIRETVHSSKAAVQATNREISQLRQLARTKN